MADNRQDTRRAAIGDALDHAGSIDDERARQIVDVLDSAVGSAEQHGPEISRPASRGLDRMIATAMADGKPPYDWNEGSRAATADEHVEMEWYAKFLASKERSGSKQAKFYQQLASKLASGKGATVPDIREERSRWPDMPDIYGLRGRALELWRERLEKKARRCNPPPSGRERDGDGRMWPD